jgi:hypothetical protein
MLGKGTRNHVAQVTGDLGCVLFLYVNPVTQFECLCVVSEFLEQHLRHRFRQDQAMSGRGF